MVSWQILLGLGSQITLCRYGEWKGSSKEYIPKSTDVKNSGSGTPSRGEAMLSSQFGDIGKRRREIMARKRLGWSPVSCEEEDSATKVKPQFIFETVQFRG